MFSKRSADSQSVFFFAIERIQKKRHCTARHNTSVILLIYIKRLDT